MRRIGGWRRGVVMGMLVLCGVLPASAVNTFTGTNAWSNAANWSGGLPVNGDDVVINGVVTGVDNTITLSSYTLNPGKTHVFNSWTANLRATSVTVSGTITHVANSDTNGTVAVYGDWTPDSGVFIVCSNLVIATGGSCNVIGKGYRGGRGAGDSGKGCGGTAVGGNNTSGGAGFGGKGGDSLRKDLPWRTSTAGAGGIAYGSTNAPADPGSGGGSGYSGYNGGDGGGYVRIAASGDVQINGTVDASGTYSGSSHSGGGSGGGIYITCNTFSGTGGVLRAKGGDSGPAGDGGPGGGGRIAVVYSPAAQSAAPVPGVSIEAGRGSGIGDTTSLSSAVTPVYRADAGSLYMPDNQLLQPYLTLLFRDVNVYGVTSWRPDSLTVSNAIVRFQEPDFDLVVTNRLTVRGAQGEFVFTATNRAFDCTALTLIDGRLTMSLKQFNHAGDTLLVNGGRLDLTAPVIQAGTNVFLTNSASLHVYAPSTNATANDYAVLFTVTNSITVTTTNTWIYPHSDTNNGGCILFRARDVLILSTNSGFYAQGTGYRGGGPSAAQGERGKGPGSGRSSAADGGDTGGGGGHGGKGSACRSFQDSTPPGGGGATNDSLTAPILPGSGGAAGYGGNGTFIGGYGGGVVRIEAGREIRVNGTINANGAYSGNDHSGGGAGGGINLKCSTLTGGALGLLTANGASTGPNGGGGGGGRIAVISGHLYTNATFQIRANGGAAGSYGTPSNGTVYLVAGAPSVDNANGATNVTSAAAWLNGSLSYTGLSAASVSVYWGETDGGQDPAGWSHTNSFPGYPALGPLTTNVALSANKVYYYRYAAVNSYGDGWADPVENFITGDVWIQATETNASEVGARGTFTVYRASTCTNENLLVYFTTSGKATNGVDYTLSPANSNVTILAGQTSAVIVVTALADADPTEGYESVVLSLGIGKYVVGLPSSNTAAIADYVPPPTNTWTGTGRWSDPTHWDGAIIPVQGQTVIIGSGTVTQDVASPQLAAFVLSAGATNLVTGTNSVLTAANMRIGGALTHVAQSDSIAPWSLDNLVSIVCTNLTIAAGGSINVNGRGYRGGPNNLDSGYGPGGGAHTGSSSSQGAGYGGAGGQGRDGPGGATYGAVSAPVDPGSGGGSGYNGTGGNGGGAVRIVAYGAVTNDGSITANGDGAGSDHSGGGSGGGIYITCRTFEGSGVVKAMGGDAFPSSPIGSAGGGGRIAIAYDAAAQAARPQPGVLFDTSAGLGGYQAPYAQPGTLYLTDGRLLRDVLTDYLRNVQIYGVTNWAPSSITVSNAAVIFREPLLDLTVPSQIVVGGSTGRLEFVSSNAACACGVLSVRDGALVMTVRSLVYTGGAYTLDAGQLTVVAGSVDFSGGDLALTNGAVLSLSATNIAAGQNLNLATGTAFHVYAVATNGISTDYTTVVSVPRTIRIASSAWIYPHSDGTSGGSAVFRMRTVSVATNAGFSALGLGFAGGSGAQGVLGKGPGAGKVNADASGGAAYGGRGGTCRYGGFQQTNTYGSSNLPVMAGSGAAAAYNTYVGGSGGGVIRLEASDAVTVDGTLDARGQSDPPGQQHAGGGSGGSILVQCHRFGGAATAQILADGGNCGTVAGSSQGGAGGGGRIAIWRITDTFAGTVSATNGLGGYGLATNEWATPGTVVWVQVPAIGTVLFIR